MTSDQIATSVVDQDRYIGRIPVRNLWLLLLYASDLGQFYGKYAADVEKSPDLPTLIGRLLAHAVERRLRRNLSRGYRQTAQILPRVRGRIDLLKTYSNDLLQKGQVACRFEEHTIDTPRNRLVRAALEAISTRVGDDVLAHRCRTLSGDLGRLGVSGIRPSRSELTLDTIARHDSEDLMMVTLSRIVFDLVLPTEDEGDHALSKFVRDEVLARRLFEKAIGNFYASELRPETGWRVQQGKRLNWPKEEETAGLAEIMPGMQTDIILEHPGDQRRIVVDTKFANILSSTEYRSRILKSGYIYQMYAYLRTQEGDTLGDKADGLLLHPTVGQNIDETVRIQGHNIRFATVDLTAKSDEILSRLAGFANEWRSC